MASNSRALGAQSNVAYGDVRLQEVCSHSKPWLMHANTGKSGRSTAISPVFKVVDQGAPAVTGPFRARLAADPLGD